MYQHGNFEGQGAKEQATISSTAMLVMTLSNNKMLGQNTCRPGMLYVPHSPSITVQVQSTVEATIEDTIPSHFLYINIF